MALRIKEICKEKQITMKEIAEKIGINHITLSQSLNGNPTLSRLQEVADIIGVSVPELFDRPLTKSVFGCIYIDEEPHLVRSKEDIESLIKTM